MLVTGLLACNLVYFLPRQFDLYRSYSGIPGRGEPRLTGFIRYDLQGRESSLSNALVTTNDRWTYTVELAPLNCPRLDCASVFALAPDGATRVALTRAFPGRTVYTIHQQGDWLIAVREAGG